MKSVYFWRLLIGIGWPHTKQALDVEAIGSCIDTNCFFYPVHIHKYTDLTMLAKLQLTLA